jgi:hypothetical protein
MDREVLNELDSEILLLRTIADKPGISSEDLRRKLDPLAPRLHFGRECDWFAALSLYVLEGVILKTPSFDSFELAKKGKQMLKDKETIRYEFVSKHQLECASSEV